MTANILSKKLPYFILFILLISMAALLFVRNADHSDSFAEITISDMLEDYDYMWHVIETEWPYLTLAEQGGFFQEKSIDWHGRRDTYRKQLEEPILYSEDQYAYNGRVLSPTEFMVAVFKDSIVPFSSAGHLFILDDKWYYPEFSAFNYSDKSRAFYETLLQTKTEKRQEQAKGNGVSFYHIDGLPVIEFRSFAESYSDKDTAKVIKEIDDFCAENAGCPDFIIDIRGNGGGNSAIWQEGLRRILLSKDATFERISGIMESSADFYTAEGVTIVNLNEDEEDALSPEIKQSLQAAGLNHAAIKIFDRETIHNGQYLNQEKIPPYQGHVWLLTDENVYSSAEMLAIFAKETGAATIVGSQTKGDGMALEGTPKIHELPNSGVMFVCSRELPMNNDGSYNAFSGTWPDILINDGEDALSAALKYIK